MSTPTRRPRRRWPWIVGVVVLVVVATAAGVALVLLDNDTTPVGVDEAVDRFRNDEGGAPRRTSLPAPGVYVYDTTGRAEIDALGGAGHDYPALTTLTVTTSGCGVRMRWVAVAERWDERLVCLDDAGLGLAEMRTFREFFGRSDDRTYGCRPGSLELPLPPDGRFDGACTSEGTDQSGPVTVQWEGRVIGVETVTIGGVSREATHVSIRSHLSGDTVGEKEVERWLLDDGLVAREELRQRSVSQSVLGAVTYTEHYTIELVSTAPRR